MKKNIGSPDKAVRILSALVIATLYMFNIISGTLAIILILVAGVFILTSFMSFCPIWFMLGISTNKKASSK